MTIIEELEKLKEEYSLIIPPEYIEYISKCNDYFEYAFNEFEANGVKYEFNNFLFASNEVCTDIYKWNKLNNVTDGYLSIATGANGESFCIKTKGDDLGSIYALYSDDEGYDIKVKIFKTFTQFLEAIRC